MILEADIRKAGEVISHAKHLICLTGSGISAESGIPTFRGREGLWNKYRAEELATYEAFVNNPKLVWDWYKWRMNIIKKAEPNIAHLTLAKWEKIELLKATITQNIDGLHQRAGNSNVIELHGNIWRAKCIKCGYKTYFEDIPKEDVPRCIKCNGLLRPDVVWFGESLDTSELNKAYKEVLQADVLIIVGTSGIVYPAAYIPVYAKEHETIVIEINPTETALTNIADIKLRMKATEAFMKIDKLIV